MSQNPNLDQLPQRSNTRLWAVGTAVTAVVAVSAAFFGLHTAEAGPTAASAEPPATPVSVATVVKSDVATWDEFSGRLEAVERVDLRSRVAGAVQAVHFKEGALVKQGDLLITIDPAPFAAEVERAEAQVAAAQSRQFGTQRPQLGVEPNHVRVLLRGAGAQRVGLRWLLAGRRARQRRVGLGRPGGAE